MPEIDELEGKVVCGFPVVISVVGKAAIANGQMIGRYSLVVPHRLAHENTVSHSNPVGTVACESTCLPRHPKFFVRHATHGCSHSHRQPSRGGSKESTDAHLDSRIEYTRSRFVTLNGPATCSPQAYKKG